MSLFTKRRKAKREQQSKEDKRLSDATKEVRKTLEGYIETRKNLTT